MRENLRKYVLSLFENMADTPRNHALRDEVLQNTMDRYDDAIAGGLSDGQAYAEAIAGMGDIESLLEPDPALQRQKKTRLILLLAAVVCVAVVGVVGGIFVRIASRVTYSIMAPSTQSAPVAVDAVVPMKTGDPFTLFSAPIDFDSAGYVCSTGNILAEGVNKLEIHWISGFVNVYESDGQHFSLQEDESNYPLCWKIDGDTLIVRPAMPGDYHDFSEKSLYLNLPAGLELEEFRLYTTSGDAFIDLLRANNVHVNTTSANVSLYDCQVGTLAMETVSGEMNFDGEVSEKIELKSVSGDAYVYTKDTPDLVNMETVSGDITLSSESSRAMEIDFDTTSGDLYCDRELAWNAAGKAVIEGSGEPAQITIETTSGDANIWSY